MYRKFTGFADVIAALDCKIAVANSGERALEFTRKKQAVWF